MNGVDQTDTGIGGHQRLALTLDVLAPEERFDGLGPSGRRPEAPRLHGLGQLAVIESRPRSLHCREERRIGEPPGRSSLLPHRFDSGDATSESPHESGRQVLGGILLVAPLALSRGRLHGCWLEGLPPQLDDRRAAARKTIPLPRAWHRCHDARNGEHVFVVPGHEQPSADEIVHSALVEREGLPQGRDGRGNDGVVISDLGVVDEAPPQGSLAGTLGQDRAVGIAHCTHDRT